jgi:hypothetical protein
MNHSLLKRIVGSAFVVLVVTFLIAGLQFYGVISIALGRICFLIAWFIGVAGIVFSEWLWQRRIRDKIVVGISAAFIFGLCLFFLDKWAKANGPTTNAAPEATSATSATPSPTSVVQEESVTGIRISKTQRPPAPSPLKQHNVAPTVGTIKQGDCGVVQNGGNGNIAAPNCSPKPRTINPQALLNAVQDIQGIRVGVWDDGSTDGGRVANQIRSGLVGWGLASGGTKSGDSGFFPHGITIEVPLNPASPAHQAGLRIKIALKEQGVDSDIEENGQFEPSFMRIKVAAQ